jgi:mRNA interferase MazF
MSEEEKNGEELPNPQRGEVWYARLDPVEGSEQAKTRPVVVMNPTRRSRASVRVCVPFVGAHSMHKRLLQCVSVEQSAKNGLTKNCTADAGQIRTLALERFAEHLGVLPLDDVQRIAAAVAVVVGYIPQGRDS